MEILLALAICALVGAAVGMMLFAMRAATSVDHDTREVTMRREVATARLSRSVRASARVLSSGPDHLVLWKSDTNGNNLPELSEVLRLQWISGSSEVQTCAAPADLDPGLDQTWAMTDDFDALTSALAGGALLPSDLLIPEVTAWSVELDDADPLAARLVVMRVTVDADSGPSEVTVIAAPRATTG